VRWIAHTSGNERTDELSLIGWPNEGGRDSLDPPTALLGEHTDSNPVEEKQLVRRHFELHRRNNEHDSLFSP
jgi:hypothetical protein